MCACSCQSSNSYISNRLKVIKTIDNSALFIFHGCEIDLCTGEPISSDLGRTSYFEDDWNNIKWICPLGVSEKKKYWSRTSLFNSLWTYSWSFPDVNHFNSTISLFYVFFNDAIKACNIKIL